MPVRSKRLFGPTVVGLVFVDLYTCPAGETTLLKCVGLYNAGIAANAVAFTINGILPAQIVARFSLAAGTGAVERELFIVLHPGDVLRGLATLVSMTVSGFGAELEGVAD